MKKMTTLTIRLLDKTCSVQGELADDQKTFVIATELGDKYEGGDRIWRQSKCWHTLHLQNELVINVTSEWYGCEGYNNVDFQTTFDNRRQIPFSFELLKKDFINLRSKGWRAIRNLISSEVKNLSRVLPPLMVENPSDAMESVLDYYGSGEQFVKYDSEIIPTEIRTSRGSYSCAEKMIAAKFDDINNVLSSKNEAVKVWDIIQTIELLSDTHVKVTKNCYPTGIPFWDMTRMIKKIIELKK